MVISLVESDFDFCPIVGGGGLPSISSKSTPHRSELNSPEYLSTAATELVPVSAACVHAKFHQNSEGHHQQHD